MNVAVVAVVEKNNFLTMKKHVDFDFDHLLSSLLMVARKNVVVVYLRIILL